MLVADASPKISMVPELVTGPCRVRAAPFSIRMPPAFAPVPVPPVAEKLAWMSSRAVAAVWILVTVAAAVAFTV